MKKIIMYLFFLYYKGYEEVECFMKECIDENGILYSYVIVLFYMIYVLFVLGYFI